MRVLFVVWPGPAHLYPVVPLAWALQSAGHQVRVGTHHSLAESVHALGLASVSVGDPAVGPSGPAKPYPDAERERLEHATAALDLGAEGDPWEVFRHFMLPGIWDYLPPGTPPEHPRPGVDDLVDFARDWRPDLVIWDPCMPGAAVAAEASGAAHARLMWWQDYFAWSVDRYAAHRGADLGEHPLAAAVRPVAERYGVEVSTDLLLGEWTLDLLPNGFRLPTSARAIPLRWVFAPAQTTVPDWLARPAERPRVAMSLGLSQREFMKGVKGGWAHVPVLMEALSELDVDVVATLNASQLDDLPTLPDNVRAVDYAPLNQLLPTCAAMIHHGGIGTFAAAAGHRVPQLITDMDAPIAMKYPVATATAGYVASRGAGLSLDIGKPSVDTLRKQLLRVLDEPSFQTGATQVYEDMLAMPSPVELVAVLERMTRRRRAG